VAERSTEHLEGVVSQMSERLGSIEATQRAMQAQLVTRQSQMATGPELRAWVALLVALLGTSVTVLLRYG
jgi:hypothetical protein